MEEKFLNNWKTLNNFAVWYKYNNYPQEPPYPTKIYQTDISISTCLFRRGQFQVEFYIAKPGFVSSKHYHPFQQMIIFMGGSGRGRRGINLSDEPDWMTLDHNSTGKILDILMPNEWHQISSGDHGMYFYNCQLWPDEKSLTSAVVEYNGDSLGPMHESIKSGIN